jgi:hypothetical protein
MIVRLYKGPTSNLDLVSIKIPPRYKVTPVIPNWLETTVVEREDDNIERDKDSDVQLDLPSELATFLFSAASNPERS